MQPAPEDRAPGDRAFEQFLTTGDPEALGRVFDHAAPRLLILAAHLAPRGSDAEDLVQNTFVRAIEAANAFERGRRVLPWLMGILTNQARRAQRQSRRQLDTDRLRPIWTPPEPSRELERTEFAHAFDAALASLTPTARRFLVLHLVHGLSHAQIAHSEGCPTGTVKSRLRRGLARLRAALPASLAGALAALTLGTSAAGMAALRREVVAAAAHAPRATSTGPASPNPGKIRAAPWPRVFLLSAGALVLGVGVWSTGVASPSPSSPPGSPPGPPPAPVSIDARGDAGTRYPKAADNPSAHRSAVAAARGDLDVELIWAEDGRPAPGIPVLLSRAHRGHRPDLHAIEMSDAAAGRVRFEDLDAGPWTVAVGPDAARVIDEVRVAGNSDATALIGSGPFVLPGTPRASVEVEIAATHHTIRLPLHRHGTVRGHVRDTAGRPIGGAVIFASVDPLAAHGGDTGVRTTGDGAFALPMWTRGLSLHARFADLAPSDHEYVLADDADEGVLLILGGATGTLTGSLRDAHGAPVAAAHIEVLPREQRNDRRPPNETFPRVAAPMRTHTNAHGQFDLTAVPVGLVAVHAIVPGRGRVTRRGTVTAAGTTHVELTLAAPMQVTGTVRDTRGAPLANVLLFAGGAATRSRRDGSYTLTGLPPGRHRITARSPTHDDARHHTRGRAGETLSWDPVLVDRAPPAPVVPPSPATLLGTVLVPGGHTSAPRVEIRALAGPRHLTLRWLTPDRFIAEDLAPGTYRVRARAPGLPWHQVGEVECPAGRQIDLGAITLRPAVPVRLDLAVDRGRLPWDLHAHVLDEHGRFLHHARVRETAREIDLPPLPPGRYRVQIGGAVVRWCQYELDLRDGKPHQGHVLLQRRMACRLLLEHPDGIPPPRGLDVRILDREGEEVMVARLEGSLMSAPLECGLGEGEYLVEVTGAANLRGQERIVVTARTRSFGVRLAPAPHTDR